MKDLEKEIMQNAVELLKTKEGISNIKMFVNLEYSWVVKYEYDGEKYLVNIENLWN